MPTFTSGYRATIGLPLANHDPEPYLWFASGGRSAQGSRWGSRPGCRHDPRRKYDVPDNPILALLRLHWESAKSRDAWIKHCLLIAQYRIRSFKTTPAERDHARRVLEHIVGVYS